MDFRLLVARAQQVMHPQPFREWLLPDGAVWMQFYRIDAGYVLRFPGLADFEIRGDALTVSCHPTPEVSDETPQHLFLNQVLPLVLSKRGKLVFHASAVEVAGVAAAFVADSGKGKSTLAASFATGGFRFLCDDGLVLESSADGFEAMPSHPSIRLWEDSQEALVGADTQTALPVAYTSKTRFLAGDDMAHCGQPRPLGRVYFLGDGSAPALILKRLSASDALAQWVKHSFMLDADERPLLTAHFERLVQLASLPIGYSLDFPRRFDILAEVRRAVVAHIHDEGRRHEAVG